MGRRLLTWLICSVCLLLSTAPALGDLAVPGWYSEGSSSWHYRLPVTLPASASPGATVHLDVDFAAALSALGIDAGSVDFDERSVRVVDPSGALVSTQQFTDRVYNGLLDPGGDARGEVRFILQGPSDGHYLYFDIAANGTKPPAPAAVINGRFEQSTGSVPDGWIRSAINTGGNQNNEVYRTATGSRINLSSGCSNGRANRLDTSPNNTGSGATGEAWHLLGYRDNCEDGSGSERVRLSRNIQVPSGDGAGFLEFYFQVQSFDGIISNSNYDWFSIYVNGSTINHNALGITGGSPTLRIDNNRFGRNGFSSSINDFGWRRARLDLSAYAGSTINFRFESRHSATDNSYRAWMKIDDVVWSQQNATLGAAEAFGANIVMPADSAAGPPGQYAAGALLSLVVVVDAAAASVSADVIDNDGTAVATGVVLFDDGSHGDLVAGDRIWSNDGSDAAFPTYTIQTADPPGSGWLLRAYALDSSPADGSSRDGLLLRSGQPPTPEIQASYFNIDEQSFIVGGAVISLEKVAAPLQDPIGGSLPKSLPGSWIRYEIEVTNLGPDVAQTLVLIDSVPDEVAVCVLTACTCPAPCSPVDPVEFDDSNSPVATGLSYDYGADVSYSLDGSDFSYSPSPDANGFDPNIRFIRIAPVGTFTGPSGADNARFFLRYVVRMD